MTVFVGTDTARTRRSLEVGGQELRLLLDRGGGGRGPRRFQPVAGGAQGRAREHAALRGRQDGDAGRHPRLLGMGDEGRPEPARDRLPAGAGADAGLHRGAGGGRPRRDARRDGGARRRSAEDQPAEPGRPRHRPLGDGRRVRQPARVPDERRARVPAQRRALRVPEVGAGRLRQLPGGAAGHRHLPPGEPRVSRADGLDRQGPVGRDRRLSRHAGRHRQPHDDGQRPRHPRLGRRRHRGGGGDARPADLDADPRGRRLQADRAR